MLIPKLYEIPWLNLASTAVCNSKCPKLLQFAATGAFVRWVPLPRLFSMQNCTSIPSFMLCSQNAGSIQSYQTREGAKWNIFVRLSRCPESLCIGKYLPCMERKLYVSLLTRGQVRPSSHFCASVEQRRLSKKWHRQKRYSSFQPLVPQSSLVSVRDCLIKYESAIRQNSVIVVVQRSTLITPAVLNHSGVAPYFRW